MWWQLLFAIASAPPLCKITRSPAYSAQSPRDCLPGSAWVDLLWGKGDFWLAPFQSCHAEKCTVWCSTLQPGADMLLLCVVFFHMDWRCITECSLFSKSNPTNYSCRVKTGGLLKFLPPLSCWQIGYWFSSIEITSQGQPNYFYSMKSRKQKVPVNLIGSFQVLQRFC